MVLVGLLSICRFSQAQCISSIRDLNYDGDSWYSNLWNCEQRFVDFWWDAYGFDKGDWDGARGYDASCDATRPLARTFNALYALHYSTPAGPAKDGKDWGGNILRWGATYVRNHADELDGSCEKKAAYATCYNCRAPIVDEYIVLHQSFFYELSVVERAATLLHEARHDEKDHDADDECPRKASCDSSWEYEGSNRYQVSWLTWFVTEGINTNVVMKKRALDRANRILSSGFAEKPSFILDDSWLSPITQKWLSLGGENGFLGYPTTDETVAPDVIGRFVHFQGGSIYWHPNTGAFEVHGAIRDRWEALGWEEFLGYPITDEKSTSDGVGRYSEFQYGSIYWHPNTGAFEVYGAIRNRWTQLSREKGIAGYPTSGELDTADKKGRYNRFQNCRIYFHPSFGAYDICGEILNKWLSNGGETGKYGYPIGTRYRSEMTEGSIHPN